MTIHYSKQIYSELATIKAEFDRIAENLYKIKKKYYAINFDISENEKLEEEIFKNECALEALEDTDEEILSKIRNKIAGLQKRIEDNKNQDTILKSIDDIFLDIDQKIQILDHQID
ncbi:MAG TPA: hypothetical protein PLK90_08370 [Clostridiales bacterium]|nr:hypothetical protein [Clostridiales bacterium]HQP70396.1 hypothetical protein [Clostridiales bacterium]